MFKDWTYVRNDLEDRQYVAEEHFVSLTDRRLAATALAIRLYQCDHAGALPQNLDALVPAYLPAVPVDAMAADGPAISYRTAGENPILYSVGSNSVDDAASESPLPGLHGWISERQRLDRVFNLTAREHPYVYIEYPPGSVFTGVMNPPHAPWEPDADSPATSQTSPAASTLPSSP